MSILLGKMVCRERVTTSGRSDREASLDESPNRPPITLGAGLLVRDDNDRWLLEREACRGRIALRQRPSE
jgi:hypothetical protein